MASHLPTATMLHGYTFVYPVEVEVGYYDVAQICMNGHVINDSARRSPEFSQKFCKKCGAETIAACPACKTAVQGAYFSEHVAVIGGRTMKAPRFCHSCGRPYPWTSARIEAARAMADELSELNESEKLLLKASIEDIVSDTPKTELAIVRFKKLVARGGKEIAGGLRQVLVDIVSETTKKALWGPGG